MPDPTDSLGRNSKSLHHWCPFLKKNHPLKLNNLDLIVSLHSNCVPGGASQDAGPNQDGLGDPIELHSRPKELRKRTSVSVLYRRRSSIEAFSDRAA